MTKKKGLEAETKYILFHPIEGGNIQNTGETGLLKWKFEKSSAKSKLPFLGKKKCFLSPIFW